MRPSISWCDFFLLTFWVLLDVKQPALEISSRISGSHVLERFSSRVGVHGVPHGEPGRDQGRAGGQPALEISSRISGLHVL